MAESRFRVRLLLQLGEVIDQRQFAASPTAEDCCQGWNGACTRCSWRRSLQPDDESWARWGWWWCGAKGLRCSVRPPVALRRSAPLPGIARARLPWLHWGKTRPREHENHTSFVRVLIEVPERESLFLAIRCCKPCGRCSAAGIPWRDSLVFIFSPSRIRPQTRTLRRAYNTHSLLQATRQAHRCD